MNSLIIATRNRGPQLRRGLASIRARRYLDLECIVVDDGSTDPVTPAVLAEHEEWIRVVRFPQGRGGDQGPGAYRRYPGAVFNAGHAVATGEIHIEQSAEVLHLTDCVGPLVEACAPNVMALASVFNGQPEDAARAQEVADAGAYLPDANSSSTAVDWGASSVRIQSGAWKLWCGGVKYPRADEFEIYCGAARPTPFMFLGALRADDWKALGGYDESALAGPNDWDLARRFLARGGSFRWCGRALAFHLRHEKT